jgi:hypothetical protein
MTAAVLREQAKSARVTGVAGALVVAIAFAMMILAAPAHSRQRPPVPAGVVSARTVAEFTQTLPPATGPGARPLQGSPAACFLLLSQYSALASGDCMS